MKIFVIVVGLSICTLLHGSDPVVSEGMSNGRVWNGLGGGDRKIGLAMKFVYVVGLADGLKQGTDEFAARLFSSPPTTDDQQKLTESVSLVPSGKGAAEVIAILDLFYEDAKNLDIPIPVAARYQREAVFGGGRGPKQLAESLERLRAIYRLSREMDSLLDKSK